MSAGQLVKELFLNFGVMVTLIYLTSAVARRFPDADPKRRAIAMVAMAVVAGWVTMLLAVRIGVLTFDLRFLPGILVAFYSRRPWVVALVFLLIGPARFYHGFNLPALYGFLILILIGLVMAAIHPWVSRRAWSDPLKIGFFVTVAVGINMVWMVLQHRYLSVNFSGVHITAIIPIQFVSTVVLCFAATLIFRDLEGERARRAALAREAFTDPLTGLPNRRHFAAHFDRLRKHRNVPISVAYVDIDHFKAINDRYGHPMGDTVLRDVGRSIAAHLRPHDYCARLGGEEFVIVLVDCPRERALRIAERLRSALEETEFPDVDPNLQVTVSIGLATAGSAEDALIHAADEALYRAKRDGRNRVVHASASS